METSNTASNDAVWVQTTRATGVVRRRYCYRPDGFGNLCNKDWLGITIKIVDRQERASRLTYILQDIRVPEHHLMLPPKTRALFIVSLVTSVQTDLRVGVGIK